VLNLKADILPSMLGYRNRFISDLIKGNIPPSQPNWNELDLR